MGCSLPAPGLRSDTAVRGGRVGCRPDLGGFGSGSVWSGRVLEGGEGGRSALGICSTSPDLARALRRNPHLKVLAASGRYDLGTPYSASDWSLAQLNAPASVLARLTHRYYDAGHMMYTRQADLKQLKADVAGWLG